MRLSDFEQKQIKQAVYHYDKQAQVILFGSRADDNLRGGDIDLLIISNTIQRPQINKIRWQLWETLGEQKIDLLLSDTQLTDVFAQAMYQQGIVL